MEQSTNHVKAEGLVSEVVYVTCQGEGPFQGLYPVSLIRFKDCLLACPFCDTKDRKALPPGHVIVTEALQRSIIVTGGEPLLRPHIEWLWKIVDLQEEHQFHFETSLSFPLSNEVFEFLSANDCILSISPKPFSELLLYSFIRSLKQLRSFVSDEQVFLKLLLPNPFPLDKAQDICFEVFKTVFPESKVVLMPLTDKNGRFSKEKFRQEVSLFHVKHGSEEFILSPRLHFLLEFD